MRYREEVLNILLAQLLSEQGLVSIPESIRKVELTRQMPDLVVRYHDVSLLIEGKVGDKPGNREEVLNDAKDKLKDDIARIALCVVYPEECKEVLGDISYTKQILATSELKVASVNYDQTQTDWHTTNIRGLSEFIKRAWQQAISEDVVDYAVGLLRGAISRFNEAVLEVLSGAPKVAEVLGISIEKGSASEIKKYAQDTNRIAGLILSSALIFHEALSSANAKVKGLRFALDQKDIIGWLIETWRFVIDKINYVPIFKVAKDILVNLPSTPELKSAIEALANSAIQIAQNRAALRHDLVGRIYHKLLKDAKYLGAYYTKVSSATLLAKLALDFSWKTNEEWADLEKLKQLRIADLACGTGTLLMAAADTLSDNFYHAHQNLGKKASQESRILFYKLLLEDVLYGYDVLPSAVHLTASTLALLAPEIAFQQMRLFSMPLTARSKAEARLGSLDFLEKHKAVIPGLFSPAKTIKGKEGEVEEEAELPDLDMCIMNPPFTRSVGGNLLFGSLPEAERERLKKQLSQLIKDKKLKANLTAGLGSPFIALANEYLKGGGKLGIVIPKTLLSGIAWSPTRELLKQGYHVEYIITSYDPEAWNFSESTELSEILLVARKLRSREEPKDTVFVNLWRNPTNSFEALLIADLVKNEQQKGLPDLHSTGTCRLSEDSVVWGEVLRVSASDFRSLRSWLIPCAFAQTELVRMAFNLLCGRIYLPGCGTLKRIEKYSLKGLGEIGPDRRAVHNAFEPTEQPTPYHAVWGHDSSQIERACIDPNKYLLPLFTPKSTESVHYQLIAPSQIWPNAARLLVAERLRLNTHRVVSAFVSRNVLSNVWWTIKVKTENPKKFELSQEELQILICGWLNSSPGILTVMIEREETQGAWISLKKPACGMLVIPDISKLKRHKRMTKKVKELLSCNPFKPFPHLNTDPARIELDNIWSEALDIPQEYFKTIREMLASEPILSLKRLGS